MQEGYQGEKHLLSAARRDQSGRDERKHIGDKNQMLHLIKPADMCARGSFMITATKLIHSRRCLQMGCHDSANVEPLVHDFLIQLRHVRDQMIANYIEVCSGGLLM